MPLGRPWRRMEPRLAPLAGELSPRQAQLGKPWEIDPIICNRRLIVILTVVLFILDSLSHA
jgi:hypothetical protein